MQKIHCSCFGWSATVEERVVTVAQQVQFALLM